MPVGLGVEGVDVLAVLGERLRQRLALGGEDVVLDTLYVGPALVLGLALPGGGLLARLRFLIDQTERLGRGLTAQGRLLCQRLGEQLRGLGDLGGFGLLGTLQFRLLLVVAVLHRLHLLCEAGLDDGGQPLVGFGHLGGGVVDHTLGLADGLFDLAEPGLELFQRGVHRLDATPDRFLRALAHGFEPLGDFLGSGRSGVHRAFGCVRTFGGVGVHLGEDAIHLREPLFVALGGFSDGVGREDGGEHLPLEAQVLDALHQHLDHENARLADDLELFRQPRPDLPADDRRAQRPERHAKLAHRSDGIGQR